MDGKTLTLPDGRRLGYLEVGDPVGKPVLYFHGWPGSRGEALLLTAAGGAITGLRLVGVDRPGMGLSDFQPGRRILDWPADILALADALGLKRFAVAGVSGGAPYAAACAYCIPERLTAVGLIAGMGPIQIGLRKAPLARRLTYVLLRFTPGLLERMVLDPLYRDVLGGARGDQGKNIMDDDLPQVDIESMADPQIAHLYREAYLEAFRQGKAGPAFDGRLYGKPWGFRLEDIRFAPVYLWHGGLDSLVPVQLARGVAQAIPGCQARFYPEEGHLSVGMKYMADIIEALTGSTSEGE